MAKYVCDFDQVNLIGDKIIQVAEDSESSISSYSSHIDSDLSTWSGSAKDSFSRTNTEQVDLATTDLAYVKELGEFVKSSARSIQELDEQLASLTI